MNTKHYTSIEQSKKLLELGLNPENTDMFYLDNSKARVPILGEYKRFDHSHTHCTGDKCELRDDCIRFLAWREAVELNLKDIEAIDRCEDVTRDYVRVRIESPKKNLQDTQ